jgi:hypothetical protein
MEFSGMNRAATEVPGLCGPGKVKWTGPYGELHALALDDEHQGLMTHSSKRPRSVTVNSSDVVAHEGHPSDAAMRVLVSRLAFYHGRQLLMWNVVGR